MEMDLESLTFNFGQLVDRVLWLTNWTRTRWTITIILAVAIVTFCTIVFIRQQKILRKLNELTKQTPQISEKGDNDHAE